MSKQDPFSDKAFEKRVQDLKRQAEPQKITAKDLIKEGTKPLADILTNEQRSLLSEFQKSNHKDHKVIGTGNELLHCLTCKKQIQYKELEPQKSEASTPKYEDAINRALNAGMTLSTMQGQRDAVYKAVELLIRQREAEAVKEHTEAVLKKWQSFPSDGDFTIYLHNEVKRLKRQAKGE